MPGDGRCRSECDISPAESPASSINSRRPVSLGWFAGDVAHAGRDLDHRPLVRAAGTATRARPTAMPSASNTSGTTPTAPGDRTMSRRNGSPSGCLEVGRRPDVPSTRSPGGTRRVSPRRRKLPAAWRQAGPSMLRRIGRVAAASQPAAWRQRQRAISSRNSGCGRSGRLLNSGWACVADPERVVGQLDELDEPLVGRRAAAPQAGRLELGPVLRVELVAVTVTFARRPARRRPRPPGCRARARRSTRRGASCRPCRSTSR